MSHLHQNSRADTTRRDSTLDQNAFEQAEFRNSDPDLARPIALGSGDITIADESEGFSYELKRAANGVAHLIVEAPSAAGRLFSSIGVAVSHLLRREAIALAAAGFGLSGAAQATKGAVMPDGSSDAAYKAYGTQFEGELLSLKVLVPGVGVGERNTSATYFNSEYALTAAHNVYDLLAFNPSYEVATGNNLLTNRGTVMPIASIMIFPGYDGTRNTPDLAILRFSHPLGGTAMTIGSASVGEVTTAAGYGKPGTPSTGLLASDGFSRAWNAPVDSFPPIDASSTYYVATRFGFSVDGISLNGKASSGDSGGPTFTSNGALAGINIAQTGDTSSVGASIYLNLAQPDVNAWIAANTVVMPEPTSLGLLGLGAAGLVLGRRRTWGKGSFTPRILSSSGQRRDSDCY